MIMRREAQEKRKRERQHQQKQLDEIMQKEPQIN